MRSEFDPTVHPSLPDKVYRESTFSIDSAESARTLNWKALSGTLRLSPVEPIMRATSSVSPPTWITLKETTSVDCAESGAIQTRPIRVVQRNDFIRKFDKKRAGADRKISARFTIFTIDVPLLEQRHRFNLDTRRRCALSNHAVQVDTRSETRSIDLYRAS